MGRISGKTVSETTDRDGKVEATYTAGVACLKENVIATARFGDKETTGRAELTIAIQGLSELPATAEYALIPSSLHGDKNHFATTQTVFRVFNLARLYRQEISKFIAEPGVLRILNISLPLGGVFDICGDINNLAKTCAEAPEGGHFSHRIGVDVDISKRDTKSLPIIEKILTKIATDRLGCPRVPEGPIHYRCILPLPQ